MDELSDNSEGVLAALLALPRLIAGQDDLVRRGRHLSTVCIVGTRQDTVFLTIERGLVTAADGGPALLRAASFAYRADPAAWTGYWQAMPAPGFHDLLALTKSKKATVEGQIQTFLTHLQYFKDLLALPRGLGGTA